ncbi:integrin alpha FG-GAP repeat containing protein 1 [Nematocida displodere]|uniref:Integrin alpha FG-GAP repeat containing protein 1 n=1 Tax=Nematocida displodere TaxID=1805483 RepID=A0A177EIT7_9MICR|nr:integrin alpha FG-GAP repeat containing protein 1 [Nematocida displodere]
MLWPWRRKDEDVAFDKAVLLMENFIPLSYGCAQKQRSTDIIGTNPERNKILVLTREGAGYVQKQALDTEHAVDYIIATDFSQSGLLDYLVISKKASGFGVSIYTASPQTQKEVGWSDTMPFLFSTGDLVPTLFLQKNRQTFFATGQSATPELAQASFGALRENHTSAFIDVNGDGVADLVLDTKDSRGRCLEVWLNVNNTFEKSSTIRVDNNSPFVFGDFLGHGSVDLLFPVNGHESGPGVAIFQNTRPFSHGKTLPDTENQDSSCFAPEPVFFPVLEKNEEIVIYNSNGPVFPAVFDVNSDTYPDLVLLVRDNNTGEVYPRSVINQEGKAFQSTDSVPYTDLGDLTVTSVSYLDAYSNKASDLLIYGEGATPAIYTLKNVSDITGYHLSMSSLSAHSPRDAYASGVVGSTYACRIVETGRMVLGFYPPQSGYAPLQSPISSMGLGRTTVFIGAVYTTVPSRTYPTSIQTDKIVPNSELLMSIRGGKIKPALYLNPDTYWTVAIPIFITLLLVFGLASAYFSYRERKRATKPYRNRYNLSFHAL